MSLRDISVSQLSAQISRIPNCCRPRTQAWDNTRSAAQGKWRSVLGMLGLHPRTLSGKHCPCPMCGGKDRFRFDDKGGRGTWICSRCGAGDGVALVMARTGLDFRGAMQRIEGVLGTAHRYEPNLQRSNDDRRAALNALWRTTSRVQTDDPVGLYLRCRIGVCDFPDCIRTAPWARYQADPVSYHPCMVAMVKDIGGRPVTLHRTYLTKDGSKAAVQDPRRLMPGPLPSGAAVRLFDCAEAMGIAEGIETAISAAFLSGLPVWAAVTAGNLADWVPPSGVHSVTVFGDNDTSFTGQAAAYRLAHRLKSKGLKVDVDIPVGSGDDWNDVLQQNANAA